MHVISNSVKNLYTENWVLQVVRGSLAFYVMNHVSRKKKVLKFSVQFFLSAAFVLYVGWGGCRSAAKHDPFYT